MRDPYKREAKAVAPDTASVLTYDRFISGREGGFQYVLAFRPAPQTDPVRFRLLVLDYTSLEAAVSRQGKNDPLPETGEEMDRRLADFMEARGRFLGVRELDLLDFSKYTVGPMLEETSSYAVKWNDFSEKFMDTRVTTIARLVFRTYSLEPQGGFYPDHLLIAPYGSRGKYARRYEALEI